MWLQWEHVSYQEEFFRATIELLHPEVVDQERAPKLSILINVSNSNIFQNIVQPVNHYDTPTLTLAHTYTHCSVLSIHSKFYCWQPRKQVLITPTSLSLPPCSCTPSEKLTNFPLLPCIFSLHLLTPFPPFFFFVWGLFFFFSRQYSCFIPPLNSPPSAECKGFNSPSLGPIEVLES